MEKIMEKRTHLSNANKSILYSPIMHNRLPKMYGGITREQGSSLDSIDEMTSDLLFTIFASLHLVWIFFKVCVHRRRL